MKSKLKSIWILATIFTIAVSTAQAQVTVPTQKLTPTDPKTTQPLRQKSLTEGQKKALREAAKPRAYPTRAYASIYYVPPANFCADRKVANTELRAYLQYQWRPDEPGGRSAILVVRLGTREVRNSVVLRGGGGEVSSELLNAAKTEICPSRCVQVRLAPATPADANRFDQRWMRACY